MAVVEVMVGERLVMVKELTVTDVRNWVAEAESGAPVDPVRAMVFDDCSLDDLARLCDMPAADMEACTVSELTPLRDKARVLNPHFFRTREALVSVSRAIQAEIDSLNLTIPLPPSPGEATPTS